MKILDKIVVKIENYVCIVTFIIMIFLTFANVVARFLLHMSLSFTEEIVTGLFVIASLPEHRLQSGTNPTWGWTSLSASCRQR